MLMTLIQIALFAVAVMLMTYLVYSLFFSPAHKQKAEAQRETHRRRFERRELERNDRRRQDLPPPGQEDRRKNSRRSRD